MKSVNIFGVLVIYNKRLSESRAYKCLKKQDVKLVVCDNSTVENDNEAIAFADGVKYISMEGNKGLAFAYNEGIKAWRNEVIADDWICLFDDDTEIPDEYFECIKKASGDILLPIVTDGRGIMSPVLMEKDIVKRIESRGMLFRTDPKQISGINSCMAVRAGIYDEYTYDNKMFLDYIDHKFIMDMRKVNKFPAVIDVEVRQQFSAIDDDKSAAVWRFEMQKKDLRIFYKENRAGYYYVVIKKHIKLALKYRDIRLLFC